MLLGKLSFLVTGLTGAVIVGCLLSECMGNRNK